MGESRTVTPSGQSPSFPNGIKRVSHRRIKKKSNKFDFLSEADRSVDEVWSMLYMYWKRDCGKNAMLPPTCGLEVFQDVCKKNDMELPIWQIWPVQQQRWHALRGYMLGLLFAVTFSRFPKSLVSSMFLLKLTASFGCSNLGSIEKSGFNRRHAFLTPLIRWHCVILTVSNSNSRFGWCGPKCACRAWTAELVRSYFYSVYWRRGRGTKWLSRTHWSVPSCRFHHFVPIPSGFSTARHIV